MLIQLFSMYLLIISSMGSPSNALQERLFRIVLLKETAEKLFGSESPVGNNRK